MSRHNISVVISEKLAQLTYTAYETSQSLLKEAKSHFPLHLNMNQLRNYGVYEFTFDPEDRYKPNEQLFIKAFGPEKAETVFKELTQLLPDGARLIYNPDGTSIKPSYEFHCYVTVLNIYLAAKYYLNNEKKDNPLYLKISNNLDRAWDNVLLQIEKIYSHRLPTENQLKEVEDIILSFQNQARAFLAYFIGKPGFLTHEDFKRAALKLFEYENRTKTGSKDPQLARLERQLNLDLFLLDYQGKFQFNRMHLPLTSQQRKKLKKQPESKEQKESKQEIEEKGMLPLLFRAIRSHEKISSLPNFYEFYEGFFDKKMGTLTIQVSGLSHGSPLNSNNGLMGELQKHDLAYQAFVNLQQDLQITRAKKIESLLLDYNASNYEPKIPLIDIQNVSLLLSEHVTQGLQDALLSRSLDAEKDFYSLFNSAFKEIKISLPRRAKNCLFGRIEDIIVVQNFYAHVINGHDDVHDDQKVLRSLAGIGTRLFSQNKQTNIEAHQFRACRVVQHALNYTPEKPALIYFCLPVIADKKIDRDVIIGPIRAAILEALFSLQTIFPKNSLSKYLNEDCHDFKLENFQKEYYESRSPVSCAAKEYILACKNGEDKDTLNALKSRFKNEENAFFKKIEGPFSKINSYIKFFSTKTPVEIILKKIFQLFNNGTDDWIKYSGVLTALFYFLSNHLNKAKKTAIMTVGGCSNNNDRWSIIALILTTMASENIINTLSNLEKVIETFNENIPYHLLNYRILLDISAVPQINFRGSRILPRLYSYYYPSGEYMGSFKDKNLALPETRLDQDRPAIDHMNKNSTAYEETDSFPDFSSGLFGVRGSFADEAVGFCQAISSEPKYFRYITQDSLCMGSPPTEPPFPEEDKAITELFMEESKEIHRHLEAQCQKEVKESGSTLVSLIVNTKIKKLSVSSLGDSLCYLIKKEGNKYVIQLVNSLHDFSDQKEVDRLQQANATIRKNSSNQWKLYLNSKLSTRISMHGAYGDKQFDPFMSREPKIAHISNYNPHTYLILASDGLTFYKNFQEPQILNLVMEQLNKHSSAESIAFALTKATTRADSRGIQGPRDDTSIIFINLDLLKPNSITHYAVADGHGPDGHVISERIASFIMQKYQKPDRPKSDMNAPQSDDDARLEKKYLTRSSLVSRQENFQKGDFGWLSEQEFISLLGNPFFLSWLKLKPSQSLQNGLNESIFNYDPKNKELDQNIRQRIDYFAKTLPPEPHNTLCQAWLVFRLNLQARLSEIESEIKNEHTSLDPHIPSLLTKANKELEKFLKEEYQLADSKEELVEIPMRPLSDSKAAKFSTLFLETFNKFIDLFSIFIRKQNLKDHYGNRLHTAESFSDCIDLFTNLIDDFYQLKIEALNSDSAQKTVRLLDPIFGSFQSIISLSKLAECLIAAANKSREVSPNEIESGPLMSYTHL